MRCGTRERFVPSADKAETLTRSATKKHSPMGWWVGIAAALVLAISAWLWLRRPTAVSQSAKSIAVLPFDNLSRDAQNDVFTDGMHDDVITALTKIHDLTVISRMSAMGYKAGTRNLRAVAAELGVAHILEGSVQRDGNRVKLNMQLIDARTDAHVWANNYTEEITDTFTVQAKLATAITTALKARFAPEEKALIARRATDSPEAHELYQRARRLEEAGSSRARAPFAEAITLYEQAIAKDPKFALAHAKLSEAHGLFYFFAWDPTSARRDKAKSALDAAERLAPDAPETLVARGVFAYRCEEDFERALAHHLAAERSLPNDADLQDYIGAALRRLGRLSEAAVRSERAMALNPRSLGIVESYALTIFYLRRYAEVEGLVQQKRAVFPGAPRLVEIGARARYARDGDAKRYTAAISATSRGRATGYTQARRVGDLNAAEAALGRLVTTGEVEDVGDGFRTLPLLRAQWAFIRGQRDEARQFGNAALTELAQRTPNSRQQGSHRGEVAMALAYAGRASEAVQAGEEALRIISAGDKFLAIRLGMDIAETFLVAEQPARALECIQQSCAAGAMNTAAELRHDPLWAPLRTDPQFDEILKLLTAR